MIKIDRIYFILIFFRIFEYWTWTTWILDVGERLLIYLSRHQKGVRDLTNLAILLRFTIFMSDFCCRSPSPKSCPVWLPIIYRTSNFRIQGYCSTAEEDFTTWLAFWRQSNRLAVTITLTYTLTYQKYTTIDKSKIKFKLLNK